MKKLILLLALFSSFLLAAGTPALVSLQGTVLNKADLSPLSSGSIKIEVYDNSTSGNLISNETFTNAVANGRFDVLVGSQSEMDLAVNKHYYVQLYVNSECVFGDGCSNPRIEFQSPVGPGPSDQLTGPLQINGALTTNTSTTSQLTVNGDANVTGNLTATNSTTSQLTVNGDASIGRLLVTQSSTSSYSGYFTGGIGVKINGDVEVSDYSGRNALSVHQADANYYSGYFFGGKGFLIGPGQTSGHTTLTGDALTVNQTNSSYHSGYFVGGKGIYGEAGSGDALIVNQTNSSYYSAHFYGGKGVKVEGDEGVTGKITSANINVTDSLTINQISQFKVCTIDSDATCNYACNGCPPAGGVYPEANKCVVGLNSTSGKFVNCSTELPSGDTCLCTRTGECATGDPALNCPAS